MEEIKARVDVTYQEGVEPEITKETWAQQKAIEFKLEPIITPGWKAPLLPAKAEIAKKPVVKAVLKSYALDIETTGIDPTDSRIIVIGVKDLRDPNSPVIQFFDLDEAKLVANFVEWCENEEPFEFVGWGLGFDLKHIFYKICAARLQAPKFLAALPYDLMDVFRLGREKGYYTLQKPDSLAKVSKYLLDREKMLTCNEVLLAWNRRDYELILEHNRNDVEIIALLWQLVQYAYGRIEVIKGVEITASESTMPIHGSIRVVCPTCMQEYFVSEEKKEITCSVCGEKIKVS